MGRRRGGGLGLIGLFFCFVPLLGILAGIFSSVFKGGGGGGGSGMDRGNG